MSLTQRFWIALSAVLVVFALVLALIVTRVAATRQAEAALIRGSVGVGDAYLPEAGGGGYDVQHYDVQVRADERGTDLTGRATITAVATEDLDVFNLDLALTASAAQVNGAPSGLEQRADQVFVTATRSEPNRPAIPSGSTFTVSVDYAGDPGAVRSMTPAYYRDTHEFVIAGEPQGAALWYPSNDHPRDAATMQFSISVPKGTEAVGAGRLVSDGADPSDATRDRWVWQIDSPTVTYATFLAVGQYRLERGVADGRPYVYVISQNLSSSEQNRALEWLRGTPASIRKLEKYLGPYPFSGMGGFVSSAEFYWGGLETAMRPVYNKHTIGSEMVLNHELGHMWLGDTVTLNEWNDLFDNESLTSYAEWLVDDDPAQNFRSVYRGRANSTGFWGPPLSDPGLDALFERVYDRGPTAVHALRTRMGDEAFFAMLRAWAQQQGPRSLEDFRRAADNATTEDLTGFFAEWLDQSDRPEPTAANGVPVVR